MRLAIVIAILMPAVASAQTVVINELMYRPWNESTSGKYEFIELYNAGAEEVDLGGHMLTDSSDLIGICHSQEPLDHEGVFDVPAGTVIAPGEYLTLWHTPVVGVTDQPGNVVYNNLRFGNLVLNNGGDQATLFTCDLAADPMVVDSFDYSIMSFASLHNRSFERISPFEPTQDASNWGYTTAATSGPLPGGVYTPGGTPGAENTIAAF